MNADKLKQLQIASGEKQRPRSSLPQIFMVVMLARLSDAASVQSVLTISGYIINRERIELSPRFLGVVKWIGVKKGDAVTNGQVVVLLDDAEYRARLTEVEGRVASAHAALSKAELDAE